MYNDNLTTEERILAGFEGVDGKRITSFRQKKTNYKDRREMGANLFRRQMIERIPYLPESLQKDLEEGRAQISDKVYYAVYDFNGSDAKVIKKSVSEAVGVTNIDKGELDKPFNLSAIQVLYSSNKATSRFGDDFPIALANGEMDVKVDGKEYIKQMAMETFSNPGNEIVEDDSATAAWAVANGYESNKAKGFRVLSNPKLILKDIFLECEINLADSLTSGSVKVLFIGTEVLPK